MLEKIAELPARELSLRRYSDDYDIEYEKIGDVFYKIERCQVFREPGHPSWDAFDAGDWRQALRLFEDERDDIRGQLAHDRDLGIVARRLRIVESPVSPYLQWAMHYFRMLAQEGMDFRVLDAAHLTSHESVRPLPEAVILGEHVLYEILYDPAGTPYGARRVDDPSVIAACRRDVAELYTRGEPLAAYFEREIAPLAPPVR